MPLMKGQKIERTVISPKIGLPADPPTYPPVLMRTLQNGEVGGGTRAAPGSR